MRWGRNSRGAARVSSRLRPSDILREGGGGLTSRKMRTALSALGVTIGIAAMVGVLGLSESSRADLRDQINALGTNLLTVSAGQGFGAGDGQLPDDAVAKISRIGPVEQVADVVELDLTVLRNDLVNPNETGGITVAAADVALLETLNGEIGEGVWFNSASAEFTNVVLGSVAAERLGIEEVDDGFQVFLGGEWFTVVGVLDPFPLAADLDRSALIGKGAAFRVFEAELNPTAVYLRTSDGALDDVRAVLPSTIDPAEPEEVSVSRPSDILEAEAAADSAFTNLFLGLGAVALLVGGIGIANVMVIAVIERRNEIGLRRALGATRTHIGSQFLTESLLLATIGGATGVALGAAVTAAYAQLQEWRVVIPPEAAIGGFLAALAIGAFAGLYPAMRAAALAPTEALRSV